MKGTSFKANLQSVNMKHMEFDVTLSSCSVFILNQQEMHPYSRDIRPINLNLFCSVINVTKITTLVVGHIEQMVPFYDVFSFLHRILLWYYFCHCTLILHVCLMLSPRISLLTVWNVFSCSCCCLFSSVLCFLSSDFLPFLVLDGFASLPSLS